jgi:hypothetical protein
MLDEGIEKQQLECKRRKQQKVLLRWRGEGVLGFGDPKAKNVMRGNGKRLGGLDIILSTWGTPIYKAGLRPLLLLGHGRNCPTQKNQKPVVG